MGSNLCCPDLGAKGGFEVAEEEVLPRYWQPQEPIQEPPASQACTETLVGSHMHTNPHTATPSQPKVVLPRITFM